MIAQKRTCLAIVLAAGQGKRMRSARPKVLHELAGRSLLAHVLMTVAAAGAERVALVVGPGHEAVVNEAKSLAPDIEIFVQSPPLGTAHAVLAAKPAIAEGYDDILVAFADTPLVRPETFARLRQGLTEPGRAITVLGFHASNPRGYGRLIRDGETLIAIREQRDLQAGEAEITFCNAGLMAIAGRDRAAIARIDRPRQCAGRILSDRYCRGGAPAWTQRGCYRNVGRRSAWHQRPPATCRS